jgi:hypothetical protein
MFNDYIFNMEILETALKYGKSISTELRFLIAGLSGSFVANASNKKMTINEKLITYTSGAVIAVYLTPIVGEFISVSDHTSYGIAFLFGNMGLKGVHMVIETIKSKIK